MYLRLPDISTGGLYHEMAGKKREFERGGPQRHERRRQDDWWRDRRNYPCPYYHVTQWRQCRGYPGKFDFHRLQFNSTYEQTAEEQELAEFVSVVLADTEEVWGEIFQQQGMTYTDPTLVLYSGSVDSACGTATSAVGPFYCPGDAKLYIDLSFYDELQQRFHAPGDFAMAYVIAHEVGHHVQTLLGTSKQLDSLRQTLSEKEYNKYQVRFELQADYFAGVQISIMLRV